MRLHTIGALIFLPILGLSAAPAEKPDYWTDCVARMELTLMVGITEKQRGESPSDLYVSGITQAAECTDRATKAFPLPLRKSYQQMLGAFMVGLEANSMTSLDHFRDMRNGFLKLATERRGKQEFPLPVSPKVAANDDAQHIASAKEKLSHDMKDPASVQYRDIVVRRSGQAVTVCGEYNAKNSYGAYTGFLKFFAANGDAFTEGALSDVRKHYLDLWRSLCALPQEATS